MGSPDYGGMAARQEKKRQALIKEGLTGVDKAYSGFTPSFYQQRTKAYENFAMPQLAEQYQQNRNAQLFSLANKGLLGGSAAGQQFSNLNQQMSKARQQIADTGIQQGQDLQRQVEASKTNLQNLVYAGADPANAASQATSTAAGFTPQSVFTPIANMFGNIANQYYLNQLMNTPRQNGGGVPSYYYGNLASAPISTSTNN